VTNDNHPLGSAGCPPCTLAMETTTFGCPKLQTFRHAPTVLLEFSSNCSHCKLWYTQEEYHWKSWWMLLQPQIIIGENGFNPLGIFSHVSRALFFSRAKNPVDQVQHVISLLSPQKNKAIRGPV